MEGKPFISKQSVLDDYDPADGCNPSGTDEIDPGIADLISLMNQTGWIETEYSCQGGHGSNSEPYIRLWCHVEKIHSLLDLLVTGHPVQVQFLQMTVSDNISHGFIGVDLRLSDENPEEAISSLETKFQDYLSTVTSP